jgi:hypothetical protein
MSRQEIERNLKAGTGVIVKGKATTGIGLYINFNVRRLGVRAPQNCHVGYTFAVTAADEEVILSQHVLYRRCQVGPPESFDLERGG